jgi:hypothetical protein
MKGGDIYICPNKLIKSVDIQDDLGIGAPRLMNVVRSLRGRLAVHIKCRSFAVINVSSSGVD